MLENQLKGRKSKSMKMLQIIAKFLAVATLCRDSAFFPCPFHSFDRTTVQIFSYKVPELEMSSLVQTKNFKMQGIS